MYKLNVQIECSFHFLNCDNYGPPPQQAIKKLKTPDLKTPEETLLVGILHLFTFGNEWAIV